MAELGLGLTIAYQAETDSGVFTPYIRGEYLHDILDNKLEAETLLGASRRRVNYQGFDPQLSTAVLGAGVNYWSGDLVDLSLNYDYEIREDYDSQVGYMKAALAF